MRLKPLDTAPQRIAKRLILKNLYLHKHAYQNEDNTLYHELMSVLCAAYERGHRAGREAKRLELREKERKSYLREQQQLKQLDEQAQSTKALRAAREKRKTARTTPLPAGYGRATLGKAFRLSR